MPEKTVFAALDPPTAAAIHRQMESAIATLGRICDEQRRIRIETQGLDRSMAAACEQIRAIMYWLDDARRVK